MVINDNGSLLNNSRMIPALMADQPGTYLRARGYLAGMGDIDPAYSAGMTQDDIMRMVQGINAEALHLINLNRVAQGLPPIAPSAVGNDMNVGLAPATMIGLGILAWFIFKRR